MAASYVIAHVVSITSLLVFIAASAGGPDARAAAPDPAATYPNRPVRLLMGPAAGGPTDGAGRRLATKLSDLWGKPVVVENRPGASNTIATAKAAQAAPDGYTLLFCPLSDSIAPSVIDGLSYDFLRDVMAVSKVGTTANIFVVHPSVPVKSVKEFIEYARSNPRKLKYGAQGTAQAGYVSMELLKSMAGNVDILYVPYKAAGVLAIDLLSGEIQAQITNLPSHLPYLKTGKVRALGVTTPKRERRLPEVPAIAETLPGFDVTTWYGVCGPAGMPAPLVSRINADIGKVLRTPELREELELYGVDAEASTPGEFAALLRSEVAKWKKVVQAIR